MIETKYIITKSKQKLFNSATQQYTRFTEAEHLAKPGEIIHKVRIESYLIEEQQ